MPGHELAQLNIATLLAPIDSPVLKDFVDNLDRINALAEAADGFVWRLQTDDGNATALRPLGDDMIVNLSVWTSVEALHAYVYRSAHIEVMRRRKAWFSTMREAYTVLWWIPRGHRPTVEEAQAKLDHLREHGPTRDAFTFKSRFPNPSPADSAGYGADDGPGDPQSPGVSTAS